MNQRIKQGVVASYLQIAVNLLFVMLFTPFLIRSLGSSDYAIYTLLYTFLSYFVMDFGMGSSLAKFITDCKYKNNTKWTEKQLLGVYFKIFFLLSGMVFVALYVAYNFLEVFFAGLTGEEVIHLKGSYIIAAVYVVVGFAATPIEAIYTANEYFAPLKMCKILQKVIFSILAVFFILMGKGLIWIIASNTVSGLFVIIIEIFFLKRYKAIEIEWDFWNTELVKELFSFSIWMAIVTFAQRFIIPIAPTILGRYSNSMEISLFSLASTLEGYVFTFAAALNGLFLPNVSRLVNEKKYNELNNLQIKISRIQTIIVSTILGGFAVFGHEFLALWVGEQYQKVYYIFLLISISDIFYLSQEIASNVLIVINKVQYRAIVYMIGAIANIAISSVLSAKFGALGTAVGIAICLWGFNIIAMMVVYQKETPLSMGLLVKKCYLSITPIMIGYSFAWVLVENMMARNTWLDLILKILIYAVGLVAVLWCLVLTQDEKRGIKENLKQVIKRAYK